MSEGPNQENKEKRNNIPPHLGEVLRNEAKRLQEELGKAVFKEVQRQGTTLTIDQANAIKNRYADELFPQLEYAIDNDKKDALQETMEDIYELLEGKISFVKSPTFKELKTIPSDGSSGAARHIGAPVRTPQESVTEMLRKLRAPKSGNQPSPAAKSPEAPANLPGRNEYPAEMPKLEEPVREAPAAEAAPMRAEGKSNIPAEVAWALQSEAKVLRGLVAGLKKPGLESRFKEMEQELQGALEKGDAKGAKEAMGALYASASIEAGMTANESPAFKELATLSEVSAETVPSPETPAAVSGEEAAVAQTGGSNEETPLPAPTPEAKEETPQPETSSPKRGSGVSSEQISRLLEGEETAPGTPLSAEFGKIFDEGKETVLTARPEDALDASRSSFQPKEMTRAEFKTQMEKLLARLPSYAKIAVPEAVNESRGKMLAAEKELQEAEAEFYKKHGAVGRKLRGKAEKVALRELEQKADLATAEYALDLEVRRAGRVKERIDTGGPQKDENVRRKTYEEIRQSKKEAGMKEGATAEEFAKKFEERYRRRFISTDTIDRSEAAREDARQEALAGKESSDFAKALAWIGKKNAWLEGKLGKHGARVARVLLSAIVGTGVAFAAGAVAAPGLIAYGGLRAGRGLLSVFGGALAGAGVGKAYEKTLGKRAASKLEKERMAITKEGENILTVSSADIAKKRKAYRKGSAEAIAKKRKVIETVGAAAFGGGILAGQMLYSAPGVSAPASSESAPPAGSKPSAAPTGKPAPVKPGPAPESPIKKPSVRADSSAAPKPRISVQPKASEGVAPRKPELDTIEVTAPRLPNPAVAEVAVEKRGGYISTVKELWKEVHKPGFKPPANLDPNSQLARLMNADEKSLNSLAVQLAKEDQYLDQNGRASKGIQFGARMEVRPDGNIEVVGKPVSGGEMREFGMTKARAEEIIRTNQERLPIKPDLEKRTLGDAFIADQQRIAAEPPIIEAAPSALAPEAPAQSAAPAEKLPEPIKNRFKLPVQAAEPHLYADPSGKEMLVFGSTYDDQVRLIEQYLKENPNAKIYGTDIEGRYRVPYVMLDGKVTIGAAARSSGFFGIGSEFKKPPGINDLKKLIK